MGLGITLKELYGAVEWGRKRSQSTLFTIQWSLHNSNLYNYQMSPSLEQEDFKKIRGIFIKLTAFDQNFQLIWGLVNVKYLFLLGFS